MSPLVTLRLLLTLALRNVRAHWVKSLIVGGILSSGTFLVVTGSSILGSIESAMQQSITASLAGHLQVYDKNAKDALSVFGQMGTTTPDNGEVPDYQPVETALMQVPEVKAVVPMGIANVTLFAGTELDRVLDGLRVAQRQDDTASTLVLAEQVRGIAKRLRSDIEASSAIVADKAAAEAEKAALDRALSDGFWQEYARDPLAGLDFLDTNIAPLASDGKMVYFRVLGTDLESYTANFDRLQIVDGTAVPPGKRGILFAKRWYEMWVKNKVARELDQIREAMKTDGSTIASDTFLQERIARNARQYQRILFQLSPTDAATLTEALQAELPGEGGDLGSLLSKFLMMDDSNFEQRYTWFYQHIAPHIRLYDAPVGEVVTLRSYTRSGYIRAVNVKLYGTFTFKGLETSDLAATANLTDLITFRSLYGQMSQSQQAELAGIREQAGVRTVSRENAEDALFGGGDALEVAAPTDASPVGVPTEAPVAGVLDTTGAPSLDDRTYTEADMDDGLVLNAAVILKDPRRIQEGLAAVRKQIDAAGLPIQAVDWEAASGVAGQLILVLKSVLFVAIFIIFLVALVIINNAMVMATVERTTEIGTMRAIGAQRSWVVWLFLLETVVLGALAGGLGALGAALFTGYLGVVGIPAPMDQFVLLFGGPRLYPLCGADDVLFGVVSVVGVSVLSALYPAVVAARVQPVVAMAPKE